jgi:hypothetical protein
MEVQFIKRLSGVPSYARHKGAVGTAHPTAVAITVQILVTKRFSALDLHAMKRRYPAGISLDGPTGRLYDSHATLESRTVNSE